MLQITNFADRLAVAIQAKKSILCCGLDPQLRYMPPHLVREAIRLYDRSFTAIGWLFTQFNYAVIDAVADFVPVVKPQRAFYEMYGPAGDQAFVDTVEYAQNRGLLVIGDTKRNDGGDTADAYADGYIGRVPFFGENEDPMVLRAVESPARVDCLTVTPYIGEDCVGRFVHRVRKFGTGIFVVTKTSFKPNSAVEQLPVADSTFRVWQRVAEMVGQWGVGTEGACGIRNVGVVVGANYPEEAGKMRQILPNANFLVPGYGSQGAGADEAVVGVLPNGLGAVINNSRALIYAFRDLKDKERGCPMQCKSEDFAEVIRRKAEIDREILVRACKRANKWPF